jgi:hypothetical protein
MEHSELQKVTKEHIASLGYDVEELYPQVFWIKDFITQDEINQVFEIINSTPEEDWSQHYMDGLRMLSRQKYGRDDIDKLVEEGLL